MCMCSPLPNGRRRQLTPLDCNSEKNSLSHNPFYPPDYLLIKTDSDTGLVCEEKNIKVVERNARHHFELQP